jgi:hypothetical protein
MLTGNQADNLKKRFDEIAPRWYNRFHYTRFKPEFIPAGRQMAKRPPGKYLAAVTEPSLFPFKDNFNLFGVDFSTGMLKQARRYAAKFNFSAELVEAEHQVPAFRQ